MTERDINSEIVSLREIGHPWKSIAKAVGLSMQAASKRYYRGAVRVDRINEQRRREAMRLRKSGLMLKEIAWAMGLHRNTVSDYLKDN